MLISSMYREFPPDSHSNLGHTAQCSYYYQIKIKLKVICYASMLICLKKWITDSEDVRNHHSYTNHCDVKKGKLVCRPFKFPASVILQTKHRMSSGIYSCSMDEKLHQPNFHIQSAIIYRKNAHCNQEWTKATW